MKNKFLTALSVFVSAFSLCFGLTACDKPDDTPQSDGDPDGAHTHSYAYTDNSDGTHDGHCSVDGCDEPDVQNQAHVWDANNTCKCGAIKPVLPPHIHDVRLWYPVKDGTHTGYCTVTGCTERITEACEYANGYCVKCDDVQPAEPCSHQMTMVYKAATCTEEGIKKHYVCSSCQLKFWDEAGTQPVDGSTVEHKIAHLTVLVPAQQASCTEEGNIKYYECSSCGKYFTQQYPADSHEITDKASVVTGKSEHAYQGGSCSVCGTRQPTVGLKFTLVDDAYSVIIGTAEADEIVIPEEYNGKPVTTIGSFAMNGYNGFKSVIIPDSVTSISSYAFQACHNLETVTMSKNVTSIGSNAFTYCSSLTSLVIPDGVSHLYPLTGCQALSSITLGSGLKTISKDAFKNCNISRVDYTGDIESWCKINRHDVFDKPYKLYINGVQPTGKITIPSGITELKDYAFKGFTEMTEIFIPDSVTSIRLLSLSYCYKLEKIEIDSNNATYLSMDGVVYDKTLNQVAYIPNALKGEITVPDGITRMNNFGIPDGVTKITVPTSVTFMDMGFGKSGHVTIVYKGDASQYENIEKTDWVSAVSQYTLVISPDEQ